MIKHEIAPNLNAVNRALEALNSCAENDDSSDEQEKLTCVRELTSIATNLTIAHGDAKKALVLAMHARGEGKVEICRGLCWETVRNPMADAVTKVYAYNILSTLSQPGYEQNFLAYSTQIVHDEIEDPAQKDSLLAVIAMLRASAKKRVKDGKRKADELEALAEEKISVDAWLERGAEKFREQAEAEEEARVSPPPSSSSSSSSPLGPVGKGGPRTPRTDQILQWAEGNVKCARSYEQILCSCGHERGRARRCLVHG
jgi:hypothetical protein